MMLQDTSLLEGRAFIDGEWIDADSGESTPVTNPATGEVIAETAKCGTAETRRAIEAAEKALPGWRSKTAKERASIMRRFFDLMIENQEDLAQILTAEMGKPLAEARVEIAYSAGFIEWFAEEGKRVYGDTIPSPSNDKRIVVIKEGIGVGLYNTWNFPSAMLGRKLELHSELGARLYVSPRTQHPYLQRPWRFLRPRWRPCGSY